MQDCLNIKKFAKMPICEPKKYQLTRLLANGAIGTTVQFGNWFLGCEQKTILVI